ncbi:MAG: beta-ketoacyl-ACP synthase III [Candidatus Firestonebacteria bacterium]
MGYKKISVGIKGIGSYVPEKILTNFDLEKMIDTSDEWITSRTGIKERRIADENTAPSDLATKAALKAMEDAKIKPEEIDMIIVATITPDMIFPSTACFVQKNIKAINATAFDISAACSGFIYGLSIANQFISSGEVKTVLLIGSETLSKVVDWQDRNTCILLGDGAGAAILGQVEDGQGILSTYTLSDGSKTNLLMVPGGGSREPISIEVINKRSHYMKMEGNEVFKYAVRGMEKSIDGALKKANLTYKDISLFIPHQANMRIIESLARRMELPKDKVFINLEKYGNTSSASIPLALDEALKTGKIKSKDTILIVSFGSGLTMAAGIIRW